MTSPDAAGPAAEIQPAATPRGDVLSLFAHETAMMFDDVPEINEAARVLTTNFVQVSERLAEEIGDAQPGRNKERKILNHADEFLMLIACLGKATLDIDDEGERIATATELMQPILRLAKGEETIPMVSGYLRLAREHRILAQKVTSPSQILAHETYESAGDNTDVQYEILKAVVGTEHPEHDPSVVGFSPRDAFSFMLHVVDVEPNRTMLDIMSEQFGNGAYDQFIATDLLVRERRGIEETQLSSLQNLQRLIGLCNPDTSPTVIDERIANATELWPGEARLRLADIRTALAQRLESILRINRKASIRFGMRSMPGTPEELYQAALDTYMDKLRTGLAEQTLLTKHERALANLGKKRKRRPLAPTTPEEVPSTPEVAAVSRAVVVIDRTTGERYAKDDARFKETTTEHIENQLRSVPDLQEDLDRIIERMGSFDLSHGKVNGVKKYEYSIAVDGEQLDVFGLKPTEVNGLSLRTSHAKNLRVLFAMLDDEVLGIIAVVPRNIVQRIERTFNRRGSR